MTRKGRGNTPEHWHGTACNGGGAVALGEGGTTWPGGLGSTSVFKKTGVKMTHDTIADRLGVFSIHVPGSPVGQGRPVIGSTGYMSLSPTRDIQPSTQLFPKSRPSHTARQAASLTKEAERILKEHDAVGEQAYQAWMESKGAEYERERARQARIKAHAVEQFRKKEAAIQAEADLRFQAWSAKKYEAAREAWAREQEKELVRSWNRGLQRCRDEQYTGRSSSREPGFTLRNDPASQLPRSFDGFEERLRQERLQQQQRQAELAERAQRKQQQRQAYALLLQQQQQRQQQQQQQQQSRRASQSPTSLPSVQEAPHEAEMVAAASTPEPQHQQDNVLPQLTANHSHTPDKAPPGSQNNGARSKDPGGSHLSPNSATPKLPPTTHVSRHLPAQHSPQPRHPGSSRHSPRTTPPSKQRNRTPQGSHGHPHPKHLHPSVHDSDKGQAPPQHAAAPGQKSEGSPPVLQSLGSMMSKLQTLDEMLQVPGLLQTAATPPPAEPMVSWRQRSSSNSSGHLNQFQSDGATATSQKSSAEQKGSRRRQLSAQDKATAAAATAAAAAAAAEGGKDGTGPDAAAVAAASAGVHGSLGQPDSRADASARSMAGTFEGALEEEASGPPGAQLLPQSSSFEHKGLLGATRVDLQPNTLIDRHSLERSSNSSSSGAQVPTEGHRTAAYSGSQPDAGELTTAKPGLNQDTIGDRKQAAWQEGAPRSAAGEAATQAAPVSTPSGVQEAADTAAEEGELEDGMGAFGMAKEDQEDSHGADMEGAGWGPREGASAGVESGLSVGGVSRHSIGDTAGVGSQTLPTVQEEAQWEADAQVDIESVGSLRTQQQQQEQLQEQHTGSGVQQHGQLVEAEPEQHSKEEGIVQGGQDEEGGVLRPSEEGEKEEGEKEEDEYSGEGDEFELPQEELQGSVEYTVEEGEEEEEEFSGAEEYSRDEEGPQ